MVSSRGFLTQGLNLCLLCFLALADRFFTTSATWEAPKSRMEIVKKINLVNLKTEELSQKTGQTRGGGGGRGKLSNCSRQKRF